jgi:hypothetical protein
VPGALPRSHVLLMQTHVGSRAGARRARRLASWPSRTDMHRAPPFWLGRALLHARRAEAAMAFRAGGRLSAPRPGGPPRAPRGPALARGGGPRRQRNAVPGAIRAGATAGAGPGRWIGCSVRRAGVHAARRAGACEPVRRPGRGGRRARVHGGGRMARTLGRGGARAASRASVAQRAHGRTWAGSSSRTELACRAGDLAWTLRGGRRPAWLDLAAEPSPHARHASGRWRALGSWRRGAGAALYADREIDPAPAIAKPTCSANWGLLVRPVRRRLAKGRREAAFPEIVDAAPGGPVPPDGAVGGLPHRGPHRWRDRYGEGDRGAGAAPALAAARQAVRRDQRLDALGRAVRVGDVWPCAGSLHGRGGGACRPRRRGGRRHALHR